MYEAQLEFPEGWGRGGVRKNPFRGGGMDIFWNYTMKICVFYMKKNGIFTLKIEILKHADFASEWQKSSFQGLEM